MRRTLLLVACVAALAVAVAFEDDGVDVDSVMNDVVPTLDNVDSLVAQDADKPATGKAAAAAEKLLLDKAADINEWADDEMVQRTISHTRGSMKKLVDQITKQTLKARVDALVDWSDDLEPRDILGRPIHKKEAPAENSIATSLQQPEDMLPPRTADTNKPLPPTPAQVAELQRLQELHELQQERAQLQQRALASLSVDRVAAEGVQLENTLGKIGLNPSEFRFRSRRFNVGGGPIQPDPEPNPPTTSQPGTNPVPPSGFRSLTPQQQQAFRFLQNEQRFNVGGPVQSDPEPNPPTTSQPGTNPVAPSGFQSAPQEQDFRFAQDESEFNVGGAIQPASDPNPASGLPGTAVEAPASDKGPPQNTRPENGGGESSTGSTTAPSQGSAAASSAKFQQLDVVMDPRPADGEGEGEGDSNGVPPDTDYGHTANAPKFADNGETQSSDSGAASTEAASTGDAGAAQGASGEENNQASGSTSSPNFKTTEDVVQTGGEMEEVPATTMTPAYVFHTDVAEPRFASARADTAGPLLAANLVDAGAPQQKAEDAKDKPSQPQQQQEKPHMVYEQFLPQLEASLNSHFIVRPGVRLLPESDALRSNAPSHMEIVDGAALQTASTNTPVQPRFREVAPAPAPAELPKGPISFNPTEMRFLQQMAKQKAPQVDPEEIQMQQDLSTLSPSERLRAQEPTVDALVDSNKAAINTMNKHYDSDLMRMMVDPDYVGLKSVEPDPISPAHQLQA